VLDHCARRILWQSLTIAGLICASGATCQRPLMMNPFAAPGPAAPQVLAENASREQIIAAVNQNSAKIQSLSATSVAITISDMMGLPILSGNIAAERPNRFRLTAGTTFGQEVDLGSNDELFWLWVKRNQPPAVYFCRHEQFASSAIRQVMPIEPTWLLATLGIIDIDPASVFDGPLPSARGAGTVELRTWLPSAGGTLQRVLVIDARRAWVLEQHVYDQAGTTLIASTVAETHRYYEREQASLPERVAIRLPSAGIAMKINLGVMQLNQLAGDRAQLWALPTFEGYPQYDLGGAAPGTPFPGAPAAQALPQSQQVVPAAFSTYPTTGYPATAMPSAYTQPVGGAANSAVVTNPGYAPLPQYGQRHSPPPPSHPRY
jgi:outer membrane lipoprotein-sorting protein